MAPPGLNAEELAHYWANFVQTKMAQVGSSTEDIEDSFFIVQRLTFAVASHVINAGYIEVPSTEERLPLTPDLMNQFLDVYVRSINYCASELRKRHLEKNVRYGILEKIGNELFNMAQLGVALQSVDNPKDLIIQGAGSQVSNQDKTQVEMMFTGSDSREYFKSSKNIQKILKSATDETLKRHIGNVVSIGPNP
jgi:transcriptional regulator with AAA-type ATPase domain